MGVLLEQGKDSSLVKIVPQLPGCDRLCPVRREMCIRDSIKTLYDKFKDLSLKDKTTEETAGADVTSFRFNLSDGTSYDLIYACYGVKNGELKSEAGGFKYFTSADIGSYWNNLNTDLEAIPINESELP